MGPDDVTLVARGWGGYPVTGAAHRLADRVSKVIHRTAFVPARRVALVDEHDVTTWGAPAVHLLGVDDGTVMPPGSASARRRCPAATTRC